MNQFYMHRPEPVEAYSLSDMLNSRYSHLYPEWVNNLIKQKILRQYNKKSFRPYVELSTRYGIMEGKFEDYIVRDRYGNVNLVSKEEFENNFDRIREGGRLEEIKKRQFKQEVMNV